MTTLRTQQKATRLWYRFCDGDWLSTLESYVKALGGELKVQAIFEGDTGPEVVTINFTDA